MHAAIVIPCLNEEATLRSTCTSLGFGDPDVLPPADAILILVDNGSDDRTLEVMEAVQRASPDRVILAQEAERGYVPPRHRGVLVARDRAARDGCSDDGVLILQADADTLYEPCYVPEMVHAARGAQGAMIEGVAHTSDEFIAAHPGYYRLADAADRAVDQFSVAEADEVIIDDKVAGYRLSDYLAWGGHRREYDRQGDEIHAETSRLYLRGKMQGADRVRAAGALAFPSRRKVEQDPLLYFATAGFPREASWRRRWQTAQGSDLKLKDFERSDAVQRFEEAVFLRQAHSLVLFSLIPAYVAQVLGRAEYSDILASPLGAFVSEISAISATDMASNPGHLFGTCLSFTESHHSTFRSFLDPTRSPT